MKQREIKFRVWDKSQNKFLDYPCYFNNKDFNEFTAFDRYFKCDEEGCILQQYTGLKDKNGREIYEGDIVQYNRRSSYDGINFEVKWSEDNWGWVLVSKNKDYLVNERTPEGYRYEFIEIVGNIFENPDLLK